MFSKILFQLTQHLRQGCKNTNLVSNKGVYYKNFDFLLLYFICAIAFNIK